jgi:DNA-directed DNA polymerase III PolC
MWLNCHSYYSLKYGTLSIEKLLELARLNGVKSIAITDLNNSTGVLECYHKVKDSYPEIQLIAGIEFRDANSNFLYTGLAKNNDGFSFLNSFLTRHNLSVRPLPPVPPASPDVFWVYKLHSFPENLTDNDFVGVALSDIPKLIRYPTLHKKLLFFNPVTFSDPSEFETHKHLRAIDFNTLISKLSPEQHAKPGDYFIPSSRVNKLLEGYEFLLENAQSICDNCSFEFDFKSNKNKKLFTASQEEDKNLLKKLAYDGAQKRFGADNSEAHLRIEHELKIIIDMNFASYFLITWDIVRYAISRGFYHVGRGSGANSVVAYCLNITDVNPIELDLYFERFLNPQRNSAPDFDIDFCWKDRDSIYDYVFAKYGSEHTALLGTVTNFKDKSVIRELGKVFGLPKLQIENLVLMPPPSEKELEKLDEISQSIFKIKKCLERTPNYRSIHAGGIIISELPLSYYTALDLPPKGYPTVQWDMHLADEIGLDKLDILSQRGIGHINEAVELIHKNRGIKIDIRDVERFKKDERVNEQLKRGDTIGSFYIESPAMRGLIRKLKCADYMTLTAASSIIRPGVSGSGMMKEFIKRYNNPGSFKYLHPVMEEQLKETLGVMVYQEDVLRVGHFYGGLDMAEADNLRRLMSGKDRSNRHLKSIHKKFFDNARQKGYPELTTAEIWRQIEYFAGFSFSKAHSASYAVESYQSLFLKVYFPLEFIVAVINNFGGFYQTWVYIYEAKKLGAHVNLPCVNTSMNLTTLSGTDVHLGFIHIQNLEKKVIDKLIREREKDGPYRNMEDFVSRTQIKIEQLLNLIKAGALRFINYNKKVLYWNAYQLLGKVTTKPESSLSLFKEPILNYSLPELPVSFSEDVFDELALFGFPISKDFFSLIRTPFRGDLLAKDLMSHVGKTVRLMGNFVNQRIVYTVRNEVMAFGCFMDVTGDFFDTVHFPDSFRQFKFEGVGIYLVKGIITEEFGSPSLQVEQMGKVKMLNE